MVAVRERLRVRLEPLCPGFDYSQHGQLNVDASLSFYYLGDGQEACGRPMDARASLLTAMEIRSRLVLDDSWDPTRVAVLKRLEPIATRLGDISTSNDCHILLERAYAALGRSRESLY